MFLSMWPIVLFSGRSMLHSRASKTSSKANIIFVELVGIRDLSRPPNYGLIP